MEKQRGLKPGMLNDRCTINIAKSQQGFIDFVIKPAYTAFAEVFPKVDRNIQQMEENKETWKTKINEYEEKMNEFNKQTMQLLPPVMGKRKSENGPTNS